MKQEVYPPSQPVKGYSHKANQGVEVECGGLSNGEGRLVFIKFVIFLQEFILELAAGYF